MDLRNSYKILLVILACSFPFLLTAQTAIRIKASVDRNSILIGERILLSLEADIPETQQIRFFNIDTIDHFEFIDKGKIDTLNTTSGTLLRQQLVITSFDSGKWVIPSYPLDLQNDILTDSFVINVAFTPFDTAQGYHDIKEIIEVEPEKEEKKNWIYLGVAGLLFLIALLYVLFRKKKPVIVTRTEKDPYEEAMEQLESLKKNREGLAKNYYTKLIDIFRNYLARRRNISSMQKTTDDLVTQLKPLPISPELYDKLAGVLRMGDYVKFAKYQPDVADKDLAFDTIQSSIVFIEKIPPQ